jgi:ribosomal protein S18 acetylase RimI-like enzyme
MDIDNDIHIIYDAHPSQEKTDLLTNKLSEIASQKKGMSPIRDYAFFLMQNDQIMGGICGCMYYGCLYIDELWIDASLRGRGFGTQLVNCVVDLAIDKKCLFCTVNTMDWEAKDFYLKLGFEIEFVRRGYLHNSTMYMLRKNL